ncbi:hypothetical protein LTR84_008845 [Exophiala bonariae]|uniref:NAD(P)-binding protein n=1 Tax=Exophiala bonariae TaxID=1690606 RepID=A0AAV9MW37_9EURO|nr:hypothetical protein LTR84_008845 [Exophiala bonariae]
MSTNTVYLITGAARGIGRGLTKAYLSRPNHTVIAAVRDVGTAKAKELLALPNAQGSKIILVKIESTSETDPKDVAASLGTEHGIVKIDVIIANSGIANYYGPIISTPVAELREHLQVNTIGPIILFQAMLPLLRASPGPKFIVVSSIIGSIASLKELPVPASAYGVSKAAVNYLVRKIHFEHPEVVAFPIHPGLVQTDMGNEGAVKFGFEGAPVTVADSVAAITSKIDSADREVSGTFVSYDGTNPPW